MAKIWVLLATERQVVDFRHRLMSRQSERRVYANVEFFNFYNLYMFTSTSMAVVFPFFSFRKISKSLPSWRLVIMGSNASDL